MLRCGCGDEGEFECERGCELFETGDDADEVALVAIVRAFVAASDEADVAMLEVVEAWGDDGRGMVNLKTRWICRRDWSGRERRRGSLRRMFGWLAC